MSSPRRTTFLLAPKNSDGRIYRKFREKSLSLKENRHFQFLHLPPSPLCFSFFWPLIQEDYTIHYLSFSFKLPNNAYFVPYFRFSTFGTIPAVHFHHLSTHATCITCIHVICDFCHISSHFPAPETRCIEKRVGLVNEILEMRSFENLRNLEVNKTRRLTMM